MDSFQLRSHIQQTVANLQATAETWLSQHYDNPENLAQCIENCGTPVYVLSGNRLERLLLAAMGVEPGFIAPSDSLKYQKLLHYLNTQYPKDTPKNTTINCDHGVFVFSPALFTVGYVAHQIHHWLAFRSGLPGYAPKAQRLYKTFWEKHNAQPEPYLKPTTCREDIQLLRQAIHRDIEAMSFLKQVTQQLFSPARQGALLTQHGAAWG